MSLTSPLISIFRDRVISLESKYIESTILLVTENVSTLLKSKSAEKHNSLLLPSDQLP